MHFIALDPRSQWLALGTSKSMWLQIANRLLPNPLLPVFSQPNELTLKNPTYWSPPSPSPSQPVFSHPLCLLTHHWTSSAVALETPRDPIPGTFDTRHYLRDLLDLVWTNQEGLTKLDPAGIKQEPKSWALRITSLLNKLSPLLRYLITFGFHCATNLILWT